MRLKRLVWFGVIAVSVSILSVSNNAVASAATIKSVTVFATGTAVNATGPDSVTVSDDSIWVSYTNGASSTGGDGKKSTIVQYDLHGKVLQKFSILGSVDGLKVDPRTGLVWALQNQDGNSTLTKIDPDQGVTHESPISYAVQSATQGYDDVVFRGNRVFLSYTNPNLSSDPTIQMVVGGTDDEIKVKTILTMGATGTDLATGQRNQPTTDTDPDSLKLTPSGDLQLSSGADGQLIFVRHPGTGDQAVAFLQLRNSDMSPVTNLDDAVFATAERGVFYLADTTNNRVLLITVDDVEAGTLFASVASVNGVTGGALFTVNTKTGVVTPFVTSAGGTHINGPHGLAFVPSDDQSGDR